MHHTTFSLQNILNQPLDKNLCKKILEEIKSPLLQQSFAMTNDQSLSQSWINPPKRPDIPPPSHHVDTSRRPAIKSNFNSNEKFNNFQPAQSFYGYDTSQNKVQKFSPNPYTQNRNFLQAVTQGFDSQIPDFKQVKGKPQYNPIDYNRIIVESIVSPLDPNINFKKQESQNQGMDIWSKFCGGLFNTGQEIKYQLQYEEGKSKFQRKKIFDSKAQTILENTKQQKKIPNRIESILLIKEQKSHITINKSQEEKIAQKSIKQVVSELNQNHHAEIAQFITLITTSIDLLSTAEKERKFLQQNIEIVYLLTTSQDNGFSGVTIGDERYNKFLQRMNFSSVSDMIRKISRKKLTSSNNLNAKQFQKLKNKVSQSLQNMLQNFSQVQKMIEQFMKLPDCIFKLKKVYKIMDESFKNDQTKNFLELLKQLILDVRLYKYESQLHQLEYIWDDLCVKLLSEQQFINGLARLNGWYRQESQLDNSRNLQQELSKLGFVKN